MIPDRTHVQLIDWFLCVKSEASGFKDDAVHTAGWNNHSWVYVTLLGFGNCFQTLPPDTSDVICLHRGLCTTLACPHISEFPPVMAKPYVQAGIKRVQPLQGCWWILELLVECVGCELSIGSLTSRLPKGRRLKLIIITFIISNVRPDARAGGGPVHPTGIRGTWLVRRRVTVRRPKGRFFRRGDTICWLSVFLTSRHHTTLRTLDEDTALQVTSCQVKNNSLTTVSASGIRSPNSQHYMLYLIKSNSPALKWK